MEGQSEPQHQATQHHAMIVLMHLHQYRPRKKAKQAPWVTGFPDVVLLHTSHGTEEPFRSAAIAIKEQEFLVSIEVLLHLAAGGTPSSSQECDPELAVHYCQR
jgi:hypothetical protein